MWKRYNYEGGVADPLIISWPKGIEAKGELRHQFMHATDVVPTVYDLLGVELPETVKGFEQIPLEGVSFQPTFASDDVPTPKQSAFFSMLGSRAVWHEGWKAVTVHPTVAGWHDFDSDRWELFDTANDPTEAHDLAAEHPEKLKQLIDEWFRLAELYNGLPLMDGTAVEVLADPTRPQVAPPRDRYVYFPDAAEVPESAAVNLRNRSYSIMVEVTVESDAAEGVLFSHGAAFGGHALYVKDRKLKYAYNFVGDTLQTVESTKEIRSGTSILGASFVRDGDSMPATGMLSLFIDDEKVGEGRITTQPGNFSLVGEGLNVGRDPASPVTDDYAGTSPHAFTGGTIKEAIVDVSGEHYVDLELEALALMKRE
jgi:arylsulfatase